MTRILIAPLHYEANDYEGSEYSRAYDYLKTLAKNKNFSGDVLVGYMDKKKIGNFNIVSFFNKKPEKIGVFTRVMFIFWVYRKSMLKLRNNKYNFIWHNGPFAIGETFSLVSLLKNSATTFILGPVVTPHIVTYPDESRSMGGKLRSVSAFRAAIDHHIYKISKLFRPLSILTLKNANIVIAKDTDGLRILRNLGLKNVQKLTMATDTTNFSHKKRHIKLRKNINLLTVCYLVKRKRVDIAIQSLAILRSVIKHPVTLTIVGDGPEKKRLMELADNLGVKNMINFAGFVPKHKLPVYYKRADIFVSTSMSDSMPAMYFEAMAASLPIIMLENNSSKELSKVRFGGTVTKTHNPTDLAKSLNRLIKNPKIIYNYGSRNYKLSQNKFNLKKNIETFVNLTNKP